MLAARLDGTLVRRGEPVLVHYGQPEAVRCAPRFDEAVFGATAVHDGVSRPHAPYKPRFDGTLVRRGGRILVHDGQPEAVRCTPRFDWAVFGATAVYDGAGRPHAPYKPSPVPLGGKAIRFRVC